MIMTTPKKDKKMVEVFDSKTNKNVFVSKDKVLEEKDRYEPIQKLKAGGLAEATAKLKAKGFSEGGAVMKDKIVSIDTSPNSGLITVKGFGASRRT